jgi:hypothetical protein
MACSRFTPFAVLVAALALASSSAGAQPAVHPPGAAPPGPCCGITSIDLRSGRISAQVNASKRAFEFIMTDRAQLPKLRVGEAISADFTTNHVTVPGAVGCCTIVSAAVVKTPAPAAPAAAAASTKPATAPASGGFDAMKTPLPDLAPTEGTTTTAIRGVQSADSENAHGERDQHLVPKTRAFITDPPHTLGRHERLKDDPAIGEYIKTTLWALKGFEIHTALLAGHKYMISSCVGMKVNAGEFALTIPDPDLRVVNDGMVLTFTVTHIAMNAFSLRFRPDPTDVIEPCHFSGAVGVSGGADNVRYELHFDPVLDLEQCKIGSMGQVHQVWRIGALHLDPLPSAVSGVAANMIEDSFTAFANFDLTDRIVAALNGAAGTQCHN